VHKKMYPFFLRLFVPIVNNGPFR